MAVKGNTQLPQLEIEVDTADFTDGLVDIMAIIRPAWEKDSIKCKLMNQGMLNKMIVVYVTEEVDNTAVVARLFGAAFRDLRSSDVQELNCSKCFAELGIGPQVYCTFKNGICYEYSTGTQYTWMDISAFRKEDMAKRVAEDLAKCHCDSSLELAKKFNVGKGKDIAAAVEKNLQEWPIKFNNQELHDLFYKDMYSAEEFRRELAQFDGDLVEGAHGLKQVLCHGDPNPTNIIFQEDKGKLIMVDHEMGGLQSPLKDLTTYILLSSLGIMGGDVDALLHSPEYIKTFLKHYLESLKKLNKEEDKPSDELVETYYNMLQRSLLYILLFSQVVTPGFCNMSEREIPPMVITMTLQRLQWYKDNKERILALKIENV